MDRTRPGPGRNEPEAVRIRLLGGFSVSVGSRSVEEDRWRLKKSASLVKLLALARGHRLQRDQLLSSLWPDLDAGSAANNLHRALHFARRALVSALPDGAPRHLLLRGDHVELCPEGPLWVDVEVFEEAAAGARRTGEPGAYRAALELYAGELLPGDRFEAWAEEKRHGLRRLRRTLLVELAALHEERGEHAPAIEALHRVLAGDPYDEETGAALMRLHVLAGRRHEALARYERLRTALRQGLGAEPGVATQRLHEEIRAGKPRRLPRLPPSDPPNRPRTPPPTTCPSRSPASWAARSG